MLAPAGRPAPGPSPDHRPVGSDPPRRQPAGPPADTLARRPEWPEGIGRLWSLPAGDVPDVLGEYLALVREFDRRKNVIWRKEVNWALESNRY